MASKVLIFNYYLTMKEKFLPTLKNLGRALTLSATIGGGVMGCLPANIADLQNIVVDLQQKKCSTETRAEIKSATQGIVDDSAEINWEKIAEDCGDDGKYNGKYDCTGKTAEILRSDYGKAVAKILQIRETGIYCPYGVRKATPGGNVETIRITKAFTIEGYDNIFFNWPIKDTCELHEVLAHEAAHLALDRKNYDHDFHWQHTDYIHMLGKISEGVCRLKEPDPFDELNQFLKDHQKPN